MFSLCSRLSFCGLPALAESYALKRATELCIDFNTRNVVFEGNHAKGVIAAITSLKQDWTWMGEQPEDIKLLFSSRSDW